MRLTSSIDAWHLLLRNICKILYSFSVIICPAWKSIVSFKEFSSIFTDNKKNSPKRGKSKCPIYQGLTVYCVHIHLDYISVTWRNLWIKYYKVILSVLKNMFKTFLRSVTVVQALKVCQKSCTWTFNHHFNVLFTSWKKFHATFLFIKSTAIN